jgi:hypothetical protein
VIVVKCHFLDDLMFKGRGQDQDQEDVLGLHIIGTTLLYIDMKDRETQGIQEGGIPHLREIIPHFHEIPPDIAPQHETPLPAHPEILHLDQPDSLPPDLNPPSPTLPSPQVPKVSTQPILSPHQHQPSNPVSKPV